MRTVPLIFILFYLLTSSTAYGQRETSPRIQNLFLKAESYRNHFAYSKAIDNYERFLTYKKNSQEAMINLADCYFKIKVYDQALLWYDSALRHGKLYPPHGVQYANLLLNQGNSEKAKAWLNEYTQQEPGDRQAKEKLNGLENINLFFRDSSLYAIKNLSINSGSPEFAPVLYKNGFIFVSSRTKKSTPYLDLYYCNGINTDTTRVELFSTNINSKLHEGPATVYDNESKLIFTRNNKIKKHEMNSINIIYFQLFYSEKNQKGEWAEPKLLSLNDKQYSMGHPTITEDGKTLYFSSTIPGGYGGSDIYKSDWKDGTWSKPTNLGTEINTMGNEMFPYVFKDSVLYFSSDGYRGLGGLDIYKVGLTNFTGVHNIGYPINSIKDDFSIAFYPSGNNGLFSSNREGGQGNDDLYSFVIKSAPAIEPEPSLAPTPIVTVYYTVQILALKNPKLVPKSFLKQLKGVVKHDGKDGLHRYTYGEYEGEDDAVGMLNTIRDMGYKDAFIRRVEKYIELSEAPGENIDLLYEKMGRIK